MYCVSIRLLKSVHWFGFSTFFTLTLGHEYMDIITYVLFYVKEPASLMAWIPLSLYNTILLKMRLKCAYTLHTLLCTHNAQSLAKLCLSFFIAILIYFGRIFLKMNDQPMVKVSFYSFLGCDSLVGWYNLFWRCFTSLTMCGHVSWKM